MPGRQQIPSFQLPSGTTAERDNSYNLTTVGNVFYNTDTSNVEIRHEDPNNSVDWRDLVVNNKEQIDISGKLVVEDDVSFNAHLSVLDASFQNDVDVEGKLYRQGTMVSPVVGQISVFAGGSTPTGWLQCDGSSLLRTTYSELFDVIGTNYGYVSSNAFNIPDLRDNFICGPPVGYSGQRGYRPAQWKAVTISSHYASSYTHSSYYPANTNQNNSGNNNCFTGQWATPGCMIRLQWDSNKIFPDNVVLMVCIKY